MVRPNMINDIADMIKSYFPESKPGYNCMIKYDYYHSVEAPSSIFLQINLLGNNYACDRKIYDEMFVEEVEKEIIYEIETWVKRLHKNKAFL